MSYRIEISPNNRAGCQDKVCKDSKTKIVKGELRFGVWFVVPGTEHGSWKWRHWGCVSGKTISNVQESIKKDDGYDWDLLDGYDEIADPDIKAKIQRVVEQGHIDAEDFNGDPEFNVPGKTAIRGRAKKPKADEEEEGDEDAAPPKKAAPKKAAGAKRGRKKVEGDEEEEEAEPEPEPAKKKARASRKAKKPEDDEEEVEEAEPEPEPVKKKARAGRKAKKAEDDGEEEEVLPVKKARGGRMAKKDDQGEAADEEVAQPSKKTKGGRKAKPVEPIADEDGDEAVGEPEEPAPAKRGRGRKAAKKEPSPPPADEEEADQEPVVKTVAIGRKRRAPRA
ncbi:hypothetical protein F5B21DRAFT_470422 [Xylaria acuta]|nr:hypothetical protein F5B21DRAFT_470422 [Xylaria acuta]